MTRTRLEFLVPLLWSASCAVTPDGAPAETEPGVEPTGVVQQSLSGGSETLCPEAAKHIGKQASEYLGYYANAKDAVEILSYLGGVIGIFEQTDPNAKWNELEAAVQSTGHAISWLGTMQFIAPLRGDATWALDLLVLSGGVIAEGSNADQSSGTAANTISEGSVFPGDAAFLRPDNPAATDGAWKDYVPDRPPVDGDGLVYDWRLGAPALLELISYRLHIIAAMDPNFRWNDRYDSRLLQYRGALQYHYDRMRGGIKCGTPLWQGWPLPYYTHVCADIHTGAFAGLPLGTGPSEDPAETIYQRLRSEVRRAMPLFEMRSMIDTLTLYINGGQDLAQGTGEIRLSQASDLCLDVQWGNPNPQTPVWMWPCSWDVAQWWVYDRPSGDIFNPVFGVCLDVVAADPLVGKAVQTYWCHGGDNQRWSYNPETQVLENALGTVLYAQSHPYNPTTEGGFFGPVLHAVHMAVEMTTPSANVSPPIAESPVVMVGDGGGVAGRSWEAIQTCSNICSEQAAPMQNACDTGCAEDICAIDPFCCEVSWDNICVSEVTSICGLHC